MTPLDSVFHELQTQGLLVSANVSDAGNASNVEFLYGAMHVLSRSFLERGQLETQALEGFTYGKLNGLRIKKTNQTKAASVMCLSVSRKVKTSRQILNSVIQPHQRTPV